MQAMQRGREHGPFDRKFEAAFRKTTEGPLQKHHTGGEHDLLAAEILDDSLLVRPPSRTLPTRERRV